MLKIFHDSPPWFTLKPLNLHYDCNQLSKQRPSRISTPQNHPHFLHMAHTDSVDSVNHPNLGIAEDTQRWRWTRGHPVPGWSVPQFHSIACPLYCACKGYRGTRAVKRLSYWVPFAAIRPTWKVYLKLYTSQVGRWLSWWKVGRYFVDLKMLLYCVNFQFRAIWYSAFDFKLNFNLVNKTGCK